MTRTFDPTTATTSSPPTPPSAAVGSYESAPSDGRRVSSGASALAAHVQALVRDHPAASLVAAAGIGAVIGWFVKR